MNDNCSMIPSALDRPQGRAIAFSTFCCFLVGLLSLSSCKPDERSSTKSVEYPYGIKHVVLISIDTLRADHLACYGHKFVKTPRIDAVAAEGILFEQHIISAPTTLPSHTSLMTGTYPHTHGVARNHFKVPVENVMLAELLRDAGFATAGFIGAVPLAPPADFDQGFDHYDYNFSFHTNKRKADHQRRAEEVTDAVLGWIEQRDVSSQASQRLFLFVHYFDPHAPYAAPEPFAGMYSHDKLKIEGTIEKIKSVASMLELIAWYRETRPRPGTGSVLLEARRKKQDTLEKAAALDREYCAEVTYCDHHVGRLIDGLDACGILDDALLIITSDHGETMHEHYKPFSHGESVYETEIHTPLIIRFPNKQFGPKTTGRLVSNIDVMPTILELLGVIAHNQIEGVSFAGVFSGKMPPRGPVFAEATSPWGSNRFKSAHWANENKFQCVRSLQYKYMARRGDDQSRFYDLVADPMERKKPARSPGPNRLETSRLLHPRANGLEHVGQAARDGGD